MPVVPTILPALDAIRSIGGLLGLRPFSVKVRRRVWYGERPGVGQHVDTDTVLTNQMPDGTLQPVLVRQLARREVIASAGLYTDRDLRVGPMTPNYQPLLQMSPGGYDDTTLDPAPMTTPQMSAETMVIVSAPNGTYGIPAAGVCCDKVGEEATALHYYVILRANGRIP